MDTNKGIKILRIISLTLGILSMLLLLYTKIAHAEEINQEPFPSGAPYTPDWKYSPFKDNPTAQNNLIASTQQALADKGYNNNPDFMLAFTNYDDNNHIYTIKVWFNAGRNGSMYEYGTYQMDGWLKDTETRCGYIAEQGTIYVTPTGELYSNNIGSAPSANYFQWTYTSARSGTTLKIGTVNDAKCIVYSTKAMYDMVGNNMNTDSGLMTINQGAVNPDGELDEGEITEALDRAQIILDAGANATDTIGQTKISTLQGMLQGIADAIYNGWKFLLDNLKSFFQPFFKGWTVIFGSIYNGIETLINGTQELIRILTEYIGNDLSAQGIANTWQTNYQASFVYTLISTGNSIKGVIQNLGNVEPQEPVINVNLGNNTFFGQTERYTFEFTWYENMRTPITTFITAFWLVGLGIHLFTQIPNIIRGASGTAKGIQNAGEMQVHK